MYRRAKPQWGLQVPIVTESILRAARISKQFTGVRALDEVDLELIPGEVHALVGENGAGKSTLVKILSGQLQPSAGALYLAGQPVAFHSPLQAQAVGVSVINQEFNLAPQQSVAENIFLGREPTRAWGLIDWPQMNARSAEVLRGLGLDVSPTQRVEFLSVADQQLVEIAKALAADFRVVIMDEPTAALNAAEVERLFEIIHNLRSRGVAILYVSHRLNEIFRMADRVTVLRDGKHVGTRPIAGMHERDVITMMLGRPLPEYAADHEAPPATQTPALTVRALEAHGAFSDISFELHYGEVVGCAGLIGSGRSALVRALFGLRRTSGGALLIDGKPADLSSPGAAIAQGLFMLPEDRKVEGIYPDLSVLENVFTADRRSEDLPSRTIIDRQSEARVYADMRDALAIRAQTPSQLITTLSGGNQQKALMARALVSEARILLLAEPTRGVDVGTRLEIHELVRRLAGKGKAVFVSSSDVPELVAVSDRCLVLSEGKIKAMLPRERISEESIVAAAVGHSASEKASST